MFPKGFLLRLAKSGLYGKGLNVRSKVFERVKNMLGKEENAAQKHFLLFPQCFQMSSFPGSLKPGLCCKELKTKLTKNHLSPYQSVEPRSDHTVWEKFTSCN